MKKWIPFAALIGTLALGALAFAPPRAGRSPKAQPYRMLMGRMLENPRLLQKLDLDIMSRSNPGPMFWRK